MKIDGNKLKGLFLMKWLVIRAMKEVVWLFFIDLITNKTTRLTFLKRKMMLRFNHSFQLKNMSPEMGFRVKTWVQKWSSGQEHVSRSGVQSKKMSLEMEFRGRGEWNVYNCCKIYSQNFYRKIECLRHLSPAESW